MFSGRETVAGPGGAASGSDLPQQRMEFVLLSGSKHYLFKRLDGSAEQVGLQVQPTERTLELLTLASPPVNTGLQGMNTCARLNPGKQKHGPSLFLWADVRKTLSLP